MMDSSSSHSRTSSSSSSRGRGRRWDYVGVSCSMTGVLVAVFLLISITMVSISVGMATQYSMDNALYDVAQRMLDNLPTAAAGATTGTGTSTTMNHHHRLVEEKSYSLAYEQSFGFFDDIPDENWRVAQKIHAQLFPNHFSNDLTQHSHSFDGVNGQYKMLARTSPRWHAQNFHEEFHCAYAQRIPTDGSPDGPKWICDPHRIAKQKDCLVYSVGSNGNVEFERGVKEQISPNCEIHTFDIRGRNKRAGNFTEALQGYSTFHRWGIGTEEQAKAYKQRRKGHPVKTLAETMQELGHTNRTIHVFKIDCEWCEWKTYSQWVESGNLMQILVEVHNSPMPEARDFFYSLHDAGYVIFNKEGNMLNGCGDIEFAFLKLRTDFFVNDSTYKEWQKQKALA